MKLRVDETGGSVLSSSQKAVNKHGRGALTLVVESVPVSMFSAIGKAGLLLLGQRMRAPRYHPSNLLLIVVMVASCSSLR